MGRESLLCRHLPHYENKVNRWLRCSVRYACGGGYAVAPATSDEFLNEVGDESRVGPGRGASSVASSLTMSRLKQFVVIYVGIT